MPNTNEQGTNRKKSWVYAKKLSKNEGKNRTKKITGWKKEKSSIWKRKMKMKGRIEERKNKTKEKKSSVG